MNKENLRKIIALRHELHQHPEISGHESQTKRRLMDFIENNTRLAVVDCGKWFYASRYVEGTKALAFRAEMDALPMDESISISHASQNPGASHKCGHDGHCSALCGLALELEATPPKRSVYLIFQHEEEIGRGARECSAILRERNIAGIYAFHNWSGYPEGSIVTRSGVCQYASAGLTVKFEGKTSHASEPEKGINPSHAIAELILQTEKLTQRFRERKVLCTIVNIRLGGKNFGISPSDGEISMTLRAENDSDMRTFCNSVLESAEILARENSLTMTREISDYFTDTSSDSECVKLVRASAESLGLKAVDMAEPFRASEDFGLYTKMIPGAIFYIGNGESYPAIHTSDYDFNDNILGIAVDMFTEILRRS